MLIRKGSLPIPIPQPLRGITGIPKFSRDVVRAIKALANRRDSVNATSKRPKSTKPPFWPTLRGNSSDGFTLDMVEGYVILRKNYGTEAMDTILPGDLPDELSVASGDKLTCQIEEDEDGIFTTATIVKTSGDWPTSTAPELVGGDNTSGTDGDRHIRLCEIETVDSVVKVKIWATGHVDHFQPSLIENAETSGYSSGDGGRTYKEFDPADGKHIFRGVIAGDGIDVTETDDTIEVAVKSSYSASHPWKAVSNGDASPATVAIAAGKLLSHFNEDISSGTPAWYHLKTAAEYAGGNVTITGTGKIYGRVFFVTGEKTSFATTVEGASGVTIEHKIMRPNGSITIEFATALPETYSGTLVFEIADASLSSGVAVIDDQILHSNPVSTSYAIGNDF